MKKIYLSVALATAFGAFAQKATNVKYGAPFDRSFVREVAKGQNNVQKAEGDVLWSNDFETEADWTVTNGPGHSSNANGSNPGWQIISAIPSTITSQQAQYGWPATFSGSTGKFAFIDSDAAGGTGTQDSYIEINTPIDLSAAGSAVLYLQFSEYYRNFLDNTYVEVSNDGGTTWVEFTANPEEEVPVNTNAVPGEIEVINITSVIGTGTWSNNVKIRFHYVGAWDWFWGIDNVQIVEAWNNDVKVVNTFVATPAGTQGLDYFTIDNSQTSFPGLTFGAIVNNNGAQAQTGVSLKITATGGFDQTGNPIALAVNATDSISMTTPYIPTGTGVKTIDLTTVLEGNTDSALGNNVDQFTLEMSSQEYGRDNGIATGSISNTTTNTGNPLKIGNIMDIFNDWQTTGAVVRLTTQAAGAAGAEYWVEAWKFDGTTYAYLAETEKKTISGTAAIWSKLKWVDGEIANGKLNLTAGDDILLMACHNGGQTEVRFGLAQNTYEQTVLGQLAGSADLFFLASPGAVMVRFTDDPTLNVGELSNDEFSIYPNPANDLINISLANEMDATIEISDLSGKVVSSAKANGLNTTIATSNLSNGMYVVSVKTATAIGSQKIVIRK